MVMKTELIAEVELGLLYRDRVFQKVLGPGVYRRPRSMMTEEAGAASSTCGSCRCAIRRWRRSR